MLAFAQQLMVIGRIGETSLAENGLQSALHKFEEHMIEIATTQREWLSTYGQLRKHVAVSLNEYAALVICQYHCQ